MKFGDYEIEYSAYVENQVEPDEGQSKEDALEEVLAYHAEKVIEQNKPTSKSAFAIRKFLSRPASELGVFVDPEAKTIYFGTEAEVQTRLASE